jgi:hypothetical protein
VYGVEFAERCYPVNIESKRLTGHKRAEMEPKLIAGKPSRDSRARRLGVASARKAQLLG